MQAYSITHSFRYFIQHPHAVIVFLYGIVMAWPAISGYIPSYDILTHLLWSVNFSNQLWLGDFYPRWLFGMNAGLGSPTFFFYGPLPYYITALFRPIAGFDPEGWRQLGLSVVLAIVLSGLSVYVWLKELTSRQAALLAAILYMSAPFHLAFDLFLRFGFAELWSFVWMPMIMRMAHAICIGRHNALFGFALGEAALILTHLPTTLIFSIVPIVYVILLSGKKQRARNAVKILMAMVFAIGLSAIYLLPAMTTQGNVSFNAMREGIFFYGYNFLYFGARFNGEFRVLIESLGVDSAVMAGVVVAGYLLSYAAFSKETRGNLSFWMGVGIAAFFMMLPLSKPIWNALPMLQAIQFPWRFNVVLTLVMAVLVAFWTWSIELHSSKVKGFLLLVASAAVIGQSLPTLVVYLVFSGSSGKPSLDKMAEQFSGRSANAKVKIEAARLGIDVPEYRPRWTSPAVLANHEALREGMQGGIKVKMPEREGAAVIQRWEVRHINFVSTARNETWITVSQLYYPGWTARLKDHSSNLLVRPSTPEGLVQILAPAGVHEVSLTLETSMNERMGQVISVMSILILLILAYRSAGAPTSGLLETQGTELFKGTDRKSVRSHKTSLP